MKKTFIIFFIFLSGCVSVQDYLPDPMPDFRSDYKNDPAARVHCADFLAGSKVEGKAGLRDKKGSIYDACVENWINEQVASAENRVYRQANRRASNMTACRILLPFTLAIPLLWPLLYDDNFCDLF